MKKYLFTIIIFVLLSAVLVMILGCAEQSYPNKNGSNTMTNTDNEKIQPNENEEKKTIIVGASISMSVSNMEEFEELLVLSRSGIVGHGIDSYNISGIDMVSNIDSYYLPTENFIEGFELRAVEISDGAIGYYYWPVGMEYIWFDYSVGILIGFITDPYWLDESNPLGPISGQIGVPLNDDGLIFEYSNYGYNRAFTPVGNTMMHIDFAQHLGGYEDLRDFILAEFTPANIISVDEMIAERFRERDVVVMFPGMEGVTISYLTDSEWVEIPGTFDNYAEFSVPNGTSHVRAEKGNLEFIFMLPQNGNFVTVLSLPIADMSITGVSVMDGDVVIAQNDNAVSVPVPANIFLPVIGEEGKYWAILIARAGGNYPVVVTVTDLSADFSEYFYTVEVPAGVANLKMWSNETFIVDINDGVSGGDTVTLMKTDQAAGMEFSIGGVNHTVQFTLDGSDPFAGLDKGWQ